MEQIDESRRKPRRTRGTPSYYYRNRFAYAVIAAGTTLFAIWACTPIFRKANKEILEKVSSITEEELARRALFKFPAARNTRAIQATLDEKKKIMSER